MSIVESMRLAWESIRSNKMRSLLTMLGIIIGIAAVIGIMTIGDGLSDFINSSMDSLGASNISVFVQQKSSDNFGISVMGGGNARMREEDLISDEMIELYQERYAEALAGVSLTKSVGSGQAQDGRLYANVSVTGVNDEYLDVNALTMLAGRALTEADIEGERTVAMVSDKLVNNMFRGDQQAALGQEIKVKVGQNIHVFTVVGVYQYEQNAMSFSMAAEEDISTSVYIPVSAAQRIVGGNKGYNSITVQANGTINNTEFATITAAFFNRFYESNEEYQVGAMSMESMTESVSEMMSTITVAIAVIAGISLLVGGIGVMNIMLVSVTERTREIGTRKALGATNGNIRIQFVVESIIVCLIGGAIGIVLGWTLGYAGSTLLGAPANPTISAIALAVSFSMAIGVFFGYYPANKAAKMDPIEALRYE